MKEVSGKSVKVTPRTTFSETAKIFSVATVGKEGLSQPEVIRASLVLSAFKGSDALVSSPFVRKIFFPDYPLSTLKWPELPTTQPNVNFTHLELNEAQKMAVEKCLSNKEEDRHVVIVVGSISGFPYVTSRRLLGTARDRQDHGNRSRYSEQGQRTQIKYNLGHRTVKCCSQERCGETGGIRFRGFQGPRLERFPFRLVSFVKYATIFSIDLDRMAFKA